MRTLRHAQFGYRGLSERTIDCVANSGVDFPERLPFMSEDDVSAIPDLGKASLAEIRSYRGKFRG